MTRSGLLSTLALLVAGCMTSVSTTRAPAPELHLLSAAALELPSSCMAPSGAVYRTAYTVGVDGRVAAASSEGEDGCVQQALRRWVSSFRYAPPAAETPTVIDWLSVTARRGS